jgi:hypothetical protein
MRLASRIQNGSDSHVLRPLSIESSEGGFFVKAKHGPCPCFALTRGRAESCLQKNMAEMARPGARHLVPKGTDMRKAQGKRPKTKRRVDEQLPGKNVRLQVGAGHEKRGLVQWIKMAGN